MLLELLHYYIKQSRPFAAFRLPGQKQAKIIAQKSNKVYRWNASDPSEGFICRPFDIENSTSPSFVICPDISISERGIKGNDFSLNPVIEELTNVCFFTENLKDFSRGEYIKAVKNICKTMHENCELKKVVYSRTESIPLPVKQRIKLFCLLLQSYPEAMTYIWFHPKIGMWCGASPELLAKMKDSYFQSSSLAGTLSLKEQFEIDWNARHYEEQRIVQEFIVNLLTNQRFQNIKVTPIEETIAGKVKHLNNHISATIQEKKYNFEKFINDFHPTPAICGYPIAYAREILKKEEPHEREYYGGVIGYFRNRADYNLYVNLRCMKIINDKGVLFVGGGILPDSIPEEEWQETVYKTHTILDVLKRLR